MRNSVATVFAAGSKFSSGGPDSSSPRDGLEESGAANSLLAIPVSGFMTTGTVRFSNDVPPPNLKGLVPRIRASPVFFGYATHGVGGEEKALNQRRGFFFREQRCLGLERD